MQNFIQNFIEVLLIANNPLYYSQLKRISLFLILHYYIVFRRFMLNIVMMVVVKMTWKNN